MRQAFSLTEVLVALVLLELGMAALMATSAVAARDLSRANRLVRARWLASDRVEQLRAGACDVSRSGSAAAPGGMTEHWRVEHVGRRRVVTDSVVLPGPGGRATSVVARRYVLCAE